MPTAVTASASLTTVRHALRLSKRHGSPARRAAA